MSVETEIPFKWQARQQACYARIGQIKDGDALLLIGVRARNQSDARHYRARVIGQDAKHERDSNLGVTAPGSEPPVVLTPAEWSNIIPDGG
jgi:hypothetical protein